MTHLQIRLVPSALLALCLLACGCSGGSSSSGSGGGSTGPAVTLSASTLSFTGTDSGYPTAAQTITITNSGATSLVVDTLQSEGADANYFSLGGNGCLETTLLPGATCTAKVVFTPIAARAYSATLTFTDNAPNSPQSVGLSGTLSTSTAPTATATLGYVMDYNGMIYSFTISSSGVWTPTSPATIGTGDIAGAMVMDPLGKFLFVAGFTSGDVSSFSIAPSTGLLVYDSTALASAADNRPENITVDPTGTFIYVSNTGMSTVTEYTVNRSNGGLTMGGTVTVPLYSGVQPEDSKPGGLITDSTGKYLYAPEAGYMAAYSIDTSTGALTPLTTPYSEGGTCYNLHMDATGKYLYCASGGTGLMIYSIDSSTGAFTGVTEWGYAIPTGQGATDVGVTSNSGYAYVTNRTDQTISLYTDDAATGYLTPMTPSTYPQVGEPYAIAIDPGGQLAYVVLEAEGLEIMTINADGTISDSSQVPIANPVAVAIYP